MSFSMLDECSRRAGLMEIPNVIMEWSFANLHLLITSRKQRDFEIALESSIQEDSRIHLRSDIVDEDIHHYVQQRLVKDKSLAKWEKIQSSGRRLRTRYLLALEGCMYVLTRFNGPRFNYVIGFAGPPASWIPWAVVGTERHSASVLLHCQ